MAFKDYVELVPPLELPFDGKVYKLPYVAAEDVPTIRAAIDPEAPRPDDDEVERILLGTVGEEMRADRVPPGFIQRVLLTALADFGSGRAYAQLVWNTAGSPDAIAAWIAEQGDNAEEAAS